MENSKADTKVNVATTTRRTTRTTLKVRYQGYHLVFLLLLAASTSLLGWHWLGNSLGTSVGLVHLGPLGQDSLLKIRTIIIGNRRFRNDTFDSSKIVGVDGGRLDGFLWLRGCLGAGLGDQGRSGFSIG